MSVQYEIAVSLTFNIFQWSFQNAKESVFNNLCGVLKQCDSHSKFSILQLKSAKVVKW